MTPKNVRPCLYLVARGYVHLPPPLTQDVTGQRKNLLTLRSHRKNRHEITARKARKTMNNKGFLGGCERGKYIDLLITIQSLYQLSYPGNLFRYGNRDSSHRQKRPTCL